jgi:hypothetical protein
MIFRKKSLIMAVLLVFASITYGTARHYAPVLIHYVVIQSLIQKAPSGVNAMMVQQRLQTHLSTAPNQSIRMQRLLHISAYLEKVQHLAPEEWNSLFSEEGPKDLIP